MKLHPRRLCITQHLLPMVKYDFRLINHASGVPVARASSSSK